jgi:CheY-like chemotaxis protein
MQVLIAEDDPTSRLMLQKLLSRWGYEVTAVADGNAAWRGLRQPGAPRLALLDWTMPGLDGVDVCRRARHDCTEGPPYLILLTGRDEKRDVVAGLTAGADDYVTKPFEPEELRARLAVGDRVLGLQEQVRERERLRGVLEMAGAVCHELSQPLQGVLGFSELLLEGMSAEDPRREALESIKAGIDRIGTLVHRVGHITRYRTRDYVGEPIVDIRTASTPDGETNRPGEPAGW